MRKLLLFLFLFVFIASLQAQNGSEDCTQQYEVKKNDLVNLCAKEYLTLAKWCKECGLSRERGDCLKDVLKYAPGNEEAATELKEEILKNGKPTANTEKILNTYDQKLSGLKKKLLDEHVKLGMWCKQVKLINEAREIFNKAIEIYENNTTARKELDQAKVSGFGWVDNETAKKLNQGLREYKGEWMPKEKVNELRSNWADAWEIKTKHYLIKTDTIYEQGYELGQQIEEFYTAFFNVFGASLDLKEPVETMAIYYYKSQEEYKKEYQKATGKQPASPYGVFSGDMMASCFWGPRTPLPGQGSEKDIMRHECTHQLAWYTSGNKLTIPEWVHEGIPIYFESCIRNKEGRLTVGSANHFRYTSFRGIMSKGQYIPLKKFLTLTPDEFKIASAITYYQAGAFIRFFMNSPDGQKYKDKFLKYLKMRIADERGYPFKQFEDCFSGVELSKLEGDFITGYLK
jgi:tetratricopeptide (TPR) repeat protein